MYSYPNSNICKPEVKLVFFYIPYYVQEGTCSMQKRKMRMICFKHYVGALSDEQSAAGICHQILGYWSAPDR